jgi:hypothetical protein
MSNTTCFFVAAVPLSAAAGLSSAFVPLAALLLEHALISASMPIMLIPIANRFFIKTLAPPFCLVYDTFVSNVAYFIIALSSWALNDAMLQKCS